MLESLLESLRLWNKNNGDRAKLQYAYFTAIIALVVVAGITSLLNVDLGRTLLGIASFAGIVFLTNAVAWALLQSFVLPHLTPSRRSSESRTTKK